MKEEVWKPITKILQLPLAVMATATPAVTATAI